MHAEATTARRRQSLVIVLLCFVFAARIHGQPEALGFISIDCGLATDASYPEKGSPQGLWFVPDAGAGGNAGIRPPHSARDMAQRYLNVRYFPDTAAAARSCYTLRGLSPGAKYLVRCSFYYGNYDGLNSLPSFDLYLGVNRWATVNVTAADDTYMTVPSADFLQVCLVDVGSGTPFISVIEVRPLGATTYPEKATVKQSLLLLNLRRPMARGSP